MFPIFRISETVGLIALKFGVWLDTHYLGVLQKYGGIQQHVRTPFLYLRNGSTDCAKISFVFEDDIYAFYMHYDERSGLHVCTCARFLHIWVTAECSV